MLYVDGTLNLPFLTLNATPTSQITNYICKFRTSDIRRLEIREQYYTPHDDTQCYVKAYHDEMT